MRGLEGWAPVNQLEYISSLPLRPVFLLREAAIRLFPGKAFKSNIYPSIEEAETDMRVVNFRAEEGRKSDVVHSLGLAALSSAMTVVPAFYIGVGLYSRAAGAGAEAATAGGGHLLGLFAGVPLVILLQQPAVKRFLEHFRCVKDWAWKGMKLITDACGVGRTREDAMASNILKRFEGDKYAQRILMISGAAHVSNLEKRLTAAGFASYEPEAR